MAATGKVSWHLPKSHPDYYQIPIADRQALLAEQEAEARRRQEDDIESFEISSGPKPEISDDEEDEDVDISAELSRETPSEAAPAAEDLPPEDGAEAAPPVAAEDEDDEDDDHETSSSTRASPATTDDHEDDVPHEVVHAHDHIHDGQEDDEIDSVAEEEAEEGVADEQTAAAAASHIPAEDGVHVDTPEPEITQNIPDIQTASEQPLEGGEAGNGESHAQPLQAQRPSQRWVRRRHYKIQEVIKRRQIILVQVVKEERGQQGRRADDLSVAGRPLLRADAQHAARRRHLPQDHQRQRPQGV